MCRCKMDSYLICGLAVVLGCIVHGVSPNRPGSSYSHHSCGFIRGVPLELRQPEHMYPDGLHHFYEKYTEAYGIPVVGSSLVPDAALQRACYVVRFLFSDRQDVREAYYQAGGRFAMMAQSEVTTDIPEYSDLSSYWNKRARGLGGTRNRPVSMGAEENALCYPNDVYKREDIVLHEFVHGLHNLGALPAIKGFAMGIDELYRNAIDQGLWEQTYARENKHEYFAEGVQTYFDAEAYANPPDGVHNQINTREKLLHYDPALHEFIQEIFPCGNHYIDRCENNREKEQNQKLRMDCNVHGEPAPVIPIHTSLTYAKPRLSQDIASHVGPSVPQHQNSLDDQSIRGNLPPQTTVESSQMSPTTSGASEHGRRGGSHPGRRRHSRRQKTGTSRSNDGTRDRSNRKPGSRRRRIRPSGSSRRRNGSRRNRQRQQIIVVGDSSATVLNTTQIAIPTACVDRDSRCPQLLQMNWCQTSQWTQTNCPRTCNLCAGQPTEASSTCRDLKTRCTVWAESGLCQKSSRYMNMYCAKTCSQCT